MTIAFVVGAAYSAIAEQPTTLEPQITKIYWTDTGTGKIQRANPDGSGTEDVLVGSVLVEPKAIVLDVQQHKMYWVDETTCKVHRAKLDGTEIEELITGLSEPPGLAVLGQSVAKPK